MSSQALSIQALSTHALPSSDILDDEDAHSAAPALSGKPSLMRRIFDALIEAQSIRAKREVDRVLGRGAYDRAMRGELHTER
jgi:hypothetical protein